MKFPLVWRSTMEKTVADLETKHAEKLDEVQRRMWSDYYEKKLNAVMLQLANARGEAIGWKALALKFQSASSRQGTRNRLGEECSHAFHGFNPPRPVRGRGTVAAIESEPCGAEGDRKADGGGK